MDRDPFRVAAPRCPRCHTELSLGEPHRCASCHGMWLSEAAVHERVATMQRALPHVEYAVDPRPAIACPACAEAMQPLLVFGVPIDRCRPHGLWFDHDELEQVLYRSHLVTRPGEPEEVPVADAPRDRAGSTSLGGAGDAGGGGGGVGELVLEALAALGSLIDL